MNYSDIDSTITKWVEKHNLSLFTSMDGVENSECRNVYISSEQGECCQIWVDKPNSGKVCIHAAEVESHHDEELSKEWCATLEELNKALDNAVSFVQQWFERKSA